MSTTQFNQCHSLIELERPSAHHATPEFPPHLFRPGDIAAIAEHSTTTTGKGKKPAKDSLASKDIEGVVYKVSDQKIVIAVKQNDSTSEELDLPERCKVYVTMIPFLHSIHLLS